MRKALILLALLLAGAVLARYHVRNQHYYPVTRLTSSDGYSFLMVQDRADTRGACGAANDRFVQPLKANCRQCSVVYARCERELQGLELQLLMGEPVDLHVVVAPGLRMAMEGPAETLRRDCENMAAVIVSGGTRHASCVYPGVTRRP